ncbi:MAG: deoxyribodipyrimidine photo-lyase, partial [Pseudomonadota bacterium]|nr:deoxyribodipyrimidine photo-lyase [Pseudomonadota bacterium]
MTTVVWFKRDLRTHDHAPLVAAAALGEPVIPLYVIEDDYWQLPDTSGRQWQFIRDSLTDLDRQLRAAGSRLWVLRGTVLDAFKQLKANHGIRRIFCHQETGGQWTFDRDKSVIQWSAENGLEFQEWRQFGVVRRLADRDLWDNAWTDLMRDSTLGAPGHIPGGGGGPTGDWQLAPQTLGLADDCPDRQAGGSARGEKLLSSFLDRRCVGYQYNISSPNTAFRACSRLSPHIAYGTVSLREIYQHAKAAGQHRNTLPRKKKSLTSFRSRLHWHCHFIQKLEDEPELEFRAMH